MTLLAACSSSDEGNPDANPTNNNDTQAPQSLVIALPDEPPDMDLMRESSSVQYAILAPNVAKGLAYLDVNGDGTIKPELATAWEEVSPKTWSVDLRTDAMFSTGEPMTAEDVVASINYGITDFTPYYDTFYPTVKDAKVVDEDTIEIHLLTPDPVLPERLVFMKPMPANTLEDPKKHQTEPFVGVGPYQIQEWARGDSITLVPNEYYTGADEATFSEVKFLFRSDVSVRAATVAAGEADLAWQIGEEQKGQVPKVIEGNGFEVAGFILNSVGQKEGGSIMEDKNVRLAVQHAVDRQAIIDSLFGGFAALPNCQGNPPGFPGLNPNLKDYAYDPELAKSLIKEAGVEGATVTILSTDFWFKSQEFTEIIANYLNEVGLKTKIIPSNLDKWLEYYGGNGEGVPNPADMHIVYHSNELFDSTIKTFDNMLSRDVGAGQWLIADPTLNDLILDSKAEGDLDVRLQKTGDVWQRYCDEAYKLDVAAPSVIHGVGEGIDWDPGLFEGIRLNEVTKAQ
jgi:peptide/nickel transport system substrate-binding protein